MRPMPGRRELPDRYRWHVGRKAEGTTAIGGTAEGTAGMGEMGEALQVELRGVHEEKDRVVVADAAGR